MKAVKYQADIDRVTNKPMFWVEVKPCWNKEVPSRKYSVKQVNITTLRIGYNICPMIKTARGEVMTKWDHLFETEEEAQETANLYNETIKCFDHVPLIDIKKLVANREALINIQNKINEKLKNHPNFDSIDFCDVGANGIQIRLHHKQIDGYTLSEQATLKYDLSNIEEVIDTSVNNFIAFDTEDNIKGYKEFLAEGDKYGWD